MSVQPLSKFYFSFEGRVNRKDWWLKYALPLLIPAFIASVIVDEVTGYSDRSGPGIFVFLIILWPALAISIKRWHDRDKSGWWMLIGAIPFIGGYLGLDRKWFSAWNSWTESLRCKDQ